MNEISIVTRLVHGLLAVSVVFAIGLVLQLAMIVG
jgi:hypothetical protein